MKNPFEKIPIEVNPLKSEHLKEGVVPILACTGIPEQFRGSFPEKNAFSEKPGSNSPTASNIDFFGNIENLKKLGFKNEGLYSYVISPIDSLDKFSEHFVNCTGIIAAGKEKDTKQEISFLSHQRPGHFLKKSDQFLLDLEERLSELKNSSEKGTIDAVIVGGNYLKEGNYAEEYTKSISFLSEKIKAILGFSPVVITGPKTEKGSEDIFYDTANRRLYIKRLFVGDGTTESFLPEDIGNQRKKWPEEQDWSQDELWNK